MAVARLAGCALPARSRRAQLARVDGDTASGRAYIQELIRLRDGSSEVNYAIYHDRYQRTPDGWKFTERACEIIGAIHPRAEFILVQSALHERGP